MPLWIPIVAAVMHLISILWLWLVIRDTRKFVDGQLWVVSDANAKLIQTSGLMWIKRLYTISIFLWIPISFIILYL